MLQKLCIIGNVTIDDLVIAPGTIRTGLPGGNAAYAALGARVWADDTNLNISIISRSGEDSARQIESLTRFEIDVSRIEVELGPSIRNWVLYTESGERQFALQVPRERRDRLCPDVDDLPPNIGEFDLIHIAGLPAKHQYRILQRLDQTPVPTQLDLGEVDREIMLQALLHLDIFLPSLTEYHLLMGTSLSFHEGMRYLAGCGPSHVIVKLGDQGSIVYDRATDRLAHIPACDAMAIDTTGAGDAYCGGFAAGWLLTQDAISAAVYATVAASFAVEGYGLDSLINAKPEVATDRKERLKDQLRHAKVLYP